MQTIRKRKDFLGRRFGVVLFQADKPQYTKCTSMTRNRQEIYRLSRSKSLATLSHTQSLDLSGLRLATPSYSRKA
jgi:hypothetical protein